MRLLRAACAVVALAAVPVALAAQPTPRPHYPVRPHTRPTPNHPGYPHGGVNHPGAKFMIDGSVVDRYLNTPTPKPRHTRKPQTIDHSFGQQTFETHATGNNR